MNDLTLILPVRTNDFSFYASRIELRDKLDLTGVETILVDDGSPNHSAAEIANFAKKRGYSLVRLETEDMPFSLSRARNAGIHAATTRWLCFEDADLIYASDYYQSLRELLGLLEQTPFNFLTTPAVYMTQEQTDKVFRAGSVDAELRQLLVGMCLENPLGSEENKIIQHYAPASSLIALEKKTALAVGGFDEAFYEWGGEDRDFVFRLLLANDRIEKPINFENTKSWNLNDTLVFEGWRSLYKLQGDFMARQGLYGFHLYHDKLEWRDGNLNSNIKMAQEKAEFYFKTKKVPMVASDKCPVDLILGRNPHIVNQQILDVLKNPFVLDEDQGVMPKEFADKVLALNPGRILLWNSVGSAWRKEVYQYLIENHDNVIVVERGALPRSIYYDQSGFCLTSTSYSEINWPERLSDSEKSAVQNYIKDLRFGDKALESQSERSGASLLRFRLGILNDTKVLFCPLQLEDDTVTTQFIEPNREYQQFLVELRRVSLSLPNDWVMIYKNHPLARNKFELSSAICADKYHINDLIEASDAIALYNSGVGLISIAFEKPVFYFGRCFYAIDGVNKQFIDASKLINELGSLFKVDREKIYRFYHFLTKSFYSFADWKSQTDIKSSTSLKVKVSSISYTDVFIPGLPRREFREDSLDLKRTILFDTYRFFYNQKMAVNSSVPIKSVAPLDTNKPTNAIQHPVSKNRGFSTKLAKLQRNPYAFFSESRIGIIRPFRHLFSAS